MVSSLSFPPVPAKHAEFLDYVQSHPEKPVDQLVQPYNEYDSVARKVFAQEPSHPALKDNHLNIVPLYDSNGSSDAKIRARDLDSESQEQKDKYLLPLKKENRRPNGSPAVVPTLKEFQNNFGIFSEGSLSDLDWSNVIVAGSAVVTSLMPVPEKYRASKRALRQFYHEKFAPASDVDLFIYGLTEEQAVEKIKQIENKISNAILYETTTVRTKNTITIVSQYPTRHVQIVLRIYKSIAEVLTGFDVDCSCTAYDGQQVYVSPRALASYITQVNQIDLSRRSPSYENRLSKYSHRGFEVFWPQLERSRIDPTIYERSFTRTVGLSRLLVLEKLPKSSDREEYLEQRRVERGRPSSNVNLQARKLAGNLKDIWEDEIADWQEEDEISDYNTVTIPYGRKYHARKIMKLLFTKDLLLNVEWNKPKDREANLHRHPAFFGYVDDVMHDCCGECPQPETDEEKQVADEESKTYISGDVSFIKDDPGRQAIGSFNPITETDWTEMAYVGNTERLCNAIVDHDVAVVKEWLSQESADPNTRDYTGRTPLHLACMTSTPEIVQVLVDHGARLIARIADGRTALHLAAARGSVEIIRILLVKSEHNEAEETKKEDLQKEQSSKDKQEAKANDKESQLDELDEDGELVSHGDDSTSYTSDSFVKVNKDEGDTADVNVPEENNELEPDIYDVDVIAWDSFASPLHLAIINDHIEAVQELVSSFGADVLLPIKIFEPSSKIPKAAILTLLLALSLPFEKAKAMTETLLKLGASPAQADVTRHTPLHYLAATSYTELLDIYTQYNHPAVKRALDHLAFVGGAWNPDMYPALSVAINSRQSTEATKLLEAGAAPLITFEQFLKSGKMTWDTIRNNDTDINKGIFRQMISQPVILAAQKDLPLIALEMIRRGADPNTYSPDGYYAENNENSRSYTKGQTILDCVREKLESLRGYNGEKTNSLKPNNPFNEEDNVYLEGFEDGSYKMFTVKAQLKSVGKKYTDMKKTYDKEVGTNLARKGLEEKKTAVKALIGDYEKLEAALLEANAKEFYEIFPDFERPDKKEEYEWRTNLEPFEVKFNFNVSDLTDTRREGYLKLFEAAWCGDLDTIRILTLGPWGENKDNAPLEMAVRDHLCFSPFDIAVLRGHMSIAKPIIEIVQTQYKPSKGKKKTFMIDNDEGEESSDDGVHVYGEVVDDEFTVDNIGEVPTEVESDTSPAKFLSWPCPVRLFIDMKAGDGSKPSWGSKVRCLEAWSDITPNNMIELAICTDNVGLLIFLLELGQEFTTADSTVETMIYTVPHSHLYLAMKLGHLRCLEQLIKKTGVGIPFDSLFRATGVELKPKSRYYRGLSFHGKKHEAWADAGFSGSPRLENTNSPLLLAAHYGAFAATEWFLGTAPGRLYCEFAKVHGEEEKFKALAKSKDGLEGSIMSWLRMQNNFVLHVAIVSWPTEESTRLVEYLLNQVPECLEVKSKEGYTPLALAFALRRLSFAKILINAGADQTVRDSKGNNLIHLLLCDLDLHPCQNADGIQDFFDLLDPRLVGTMLTERSSDEPGSVTPLARWLHYVHLYPASRSQGLDRNTEDDGTIAVVRVLLDLAESTGQKHLEVLDGTGSTPVHHTIKLQLPRTLELMITRRPDLLHRENATGSTPFELAVDARTIEVTTGPPPIPSTGGWSEPKEQWRNVLDRSPEYFAKQGIQQTEREMICELCRERSSGQQKRKLVTLHEANEVAKRLAARKRGYESRVQDDSRDEVKGWYSVAKSRGCKDADAESVTARELSTEI